MRIKYIFIICAIIYALTSCSQDEPAEQLPGSGNKPTMRQIKINFHTTIEGSSSRAESETFEPQDGDIMIFIFKDSPLYSLETIARYDKTQDIWNFYDWGFRNSYRANCEIAYYGKDAQYHDQNPAGISCDISANTCIYEDDNAIYTLRAENDMDLYAKFAPKTCQVKFKSNQEFSGSLLGLGFYRYSGALKSLSSNDIVFTKASTSSPVAVKVESTADGYFSSYYYVFSNGTPLRFIESYNVYVWKKNTVEYFRPGKSGIIELPSLNPDNWISEPFLQKKTDDISVSYQTEGQWTTHTLETTRINSKVGIGFRCNCLCTISDWDWGDEYPFRIKIDALDDSNNIIDSYLINVNNADIPKSKTVSFQDYYYHKNASAYQISFYRYKVNVSVTNFYISNY